MERLKQMRTFSFDDRKLTLKDGYCSHSFITAEGGNQFDSIIITSKEKKVTMPSRKPN